MKQTERQFSVKLIRRLKKQLPGAFIYKIPDTAGLGGMRPFDLLLVFRGLACAIELKRDDKQKLTPWQKHMLNKFVEAGCYAFVVTPTSVRKYPETPEK